MMNTLRKIIKTVRYALVWFFYFIRFSVRQFYRQRGLQIASSLAYTTLLSLVPLITVMFGFLKGLPVIEKMGGAIQEFIFSNFVPAFGGTVQEYLTAFSQKAANLKVSGTIVLVVIALMLMATIDSAFNHIWHVRNRRKVVARFLVYWAILTLGPLLLGIGLLSTSYLLSLPVLNEMDANLEIKKQFLSWLPFFTTAIAFTLLYMLIPNCHVPARKAFAGGLISAMLFEFAKYGFGIYVKAVPTYQAIYGTIAVIPMFLIWIYTSWVIVILGAHITFCLTAFRLKVEISGAREHPWNLIDVFKIIAILWESQREGRGLPFQALQKRGIKLPHYQINEIMDRLRRKHWVHADANGKWFLSRDLTQATVMDLYEAVPNCMPLADEVISDDKQTRSVRQLLEAHHDKLTATMSVPVASLFEKQEA